MGDEFIEGKSSVDFRKYIFVLLGFIVFISLFFVFVPLEKTPVIPTCGDSSLYETCSLSKPYFCSGEGYLVFDAGVCGCPDSLTKKEGSCTSQYFTSQGDVSLKYFLEGVEEEIDFIYYGGISDYLDTLPRNIIYQGDEMPRRDDFKFLKIDQEIQIEGLMPLIVDIQNLYPDSKDMQALVAISLVQNIPYGEPEFSSFLGTEMRLARYPYQVLEENVGSCEGKSELLALILRELGFGVSLFYYSAENHEAVGIKCPVEYSLEGSGYCFVETTVPSPVSYSEGRYLSLSGSGKLQSKPEVVLISEGISLSGGLDVYRDANWLKKIIEDIDEDGKINYFYKKRFDSLIEKYGLPYQ